jgi:hypothetical protein
LALSTTSFNRETVTFFIPFIPRSGYIPQTRVAAKQRTLGYAYPTTYLP